MRRRYPWAGPASGGIAHEFCRTRSVICRAGRRTARVDRIRRRERRGGEEGVHARRRCHREDRRLHRREEDRYREESLEGAAAAADYYWNLATNKGDIVVEFMPDVAPKHVSSTIYLTRIGFYDDIVFHRIIPRFMAQGGDPTGTGAGGPGYDYEGEFDKRVKHDRPGLLSMANRGPGTDGSQFFLTFVKTPHLDGKHTIFGKVVEGMDTLRDIEKVGTARTGKPKERVVIEKATISVKAGD
jgi:cyclophilin family peptidyl-prolyl cis-trans isomerase